MPLFVAVTLAEPIAVVEQAAMFIATVSNTGSAAVTLNSLSVNEVTKTGCMITQPNYLPLNSPVGVGNPVISAGGSQSFPFGVVFTAPYSAGSSPNNQPGGSAPGQNSQPANSNVTLQAVGQASDGSVFSGNVLVPVLSASAPFPVPQGGALQFGQGADLINLTFLGAL